MKWATKLEKLGIVTAKFNDLFNYILLSNLWNERSRKSRKMFLSALNRCLNALKRPNVTILAADMEIKLNHNYLSNPRKTYVCIRVQAGDLVLESWSSKSIKDKGQRLRRIPTRSMRPFKPEGVEWRWTKSTMELFNVSPIFFIHIFLVLHIFSFLYNKQTKNLVTTKGRHLRDTVFLSKVLTSVKIAKCLRRWFLRLFRLQDRRILEAGGDLPPSDFDRSIM